MYLSIHIYIETSDSRGNALAPSPVVVHSALGKGVQTSFQTHNCKNIYMNLYINICKYPKEYTCISLASNACRNVAISYTTQPNAHMFILFEYCY